MSEKPSKNTSQDSKMFYRISKFFCKKPCGFSKRCYGASAGCASPPKDPCGENIESEFDVPPQEMKRVKSWSPDPEFMAQFNGPVLYPDAMTSKWKVPPYNRMVRPVERPFILRQVNWGPQHPAAHGALRLIIELDGEIIRSAKPHIGLLHRGTEKLMEYHTYMQNLPYMDRLDYVSVMSCEQVYCLAVEKLLNIEVPLRAKFIRSMFAELSRLTNHFIAMASNILDFGAITPFFWMCEEREKVYEFCERASGSRMHSNYFRVGGVAQDIPMGLMEDLYDFVSKLGERMDEVEDVCTHNRVFLARTVGIGPMTADEILNRGGTGIFLRAAGVKYDLRKQQPYDAYEHLEFDVPIGRHGDVFDRYLCRVQEIRESAKIIAQCCNLMPPGEIKTDDAKVCPPKRAEMKTSMEALIHHFKYFTEGFSVPPGSAYAAVEGPKGEMGVYMVSDGSTKPYRCRLRTSGVAHLQAFGDLLEGQMLADIGGILGGLDVVFGEVDR